MTSKAFEYCNPCTTIQQYESELYNMQLLQNYLEMLAMPTYMGVSISSTRLLRSFIIHQQSNSDLFVRGGGAKQKNG